MFFVIAVGPKKEVGGGFARSPFDAMSSGEAMAAATCKGVASDAEAKQQAELQRQVGTGAASGMR
jgi:hypothetical protein